MGIKTMIIVIVVAVVGMTMMGISVEAFVTDTLDTLAGKVRDDMVSIPGPQSGDIVCDIFFDITFREKLTTSFSDVNTVLFFNQDGKTVNIDYENCAKVSGLPTLTFLDFVGKTEVTPAELIIPNQSVFPHEFTLDYILVDENGREKKLPHYQNVVYKVPAFNSEFDFTQKLIYRNIVLADYTLKIVPEHARFADHKAGEPYIQQVNAP